MITSVPLHMTWCHSANYVIGVYNLQLCAVNWTYSPYSLLSYYFCSWNLLFILFQFFHHCLSVLLLYWSVSSAQSFIFHDYQVLWRNLFWKKAIYIQYYAIIIAIIMDPCTTVLFCFIVVLLIGLPLLCLVLFHHKTHSIQSFHTGFTFFQHTVCKNDQLKHSITNAAIFLASNNFENTRHTNISTRFSVTDANHFAQWQ